MKEWVWSGVRFPQCFFWDHIASMDLRRLYDWMSPHKASQSGLLFCCTGMHFERGDEVSADVMHQVLEDEIRRTPRSGGDSGIETPKVPVGGLCEDPYPLLLPGKGRV